MTRQELTRSLREIVGESVRLQEDLPSRRLYSRDLADVPKPFRRLFRSVPDLVVQPRGLEDLSAIARLAQKARIPVLPRGIGSWGYGGAIPTQAGLVIDLARMKRISEPVGHEILVEAGARWGELDFFLEGRGLRFPVHPSNRYGTVGGWFATGGYGLNGLRHGHASRHVSSLVVVLPDGTLREISAEDPEFSLWFGSEGQLGTLAAVRLKLMPQAAADRPLLLYFQSFEKACEWMLRLRDLPTPPATAKALDAAHMRAIIASHHRRRPGGPDILEPRDALLLHFDDKQAFERFVREFGGVEGRFESGDARRAPDWVASYLWGDRYHPLKVQLLGPGLLASEHLFDPDRYGRFVLRARRAAARFGRELILEAMLVRSGEETQILSLATWITDKRADAAHLLHLALAPLLTRLGVRVGGRPYGLGIWNGPFFRHRFLGRKGQKIMALKRRIDPGGVQNPGKFHRVRTRGPLSTLFFHPAIFEGLLDLGLLFSPLLGAFARGASRGAARADAAESLLARAVEDCTNCGNCVTVCPAWTLTGHEQTTGRGKLFLASKLLAGETIEKGESDWAQHCTVCAACADVCQTEIPLVEAYAELERELASRHGRPEEQIRAFVESLGGEDDYLRLIGSEPYGERHVVG